VPAPGSIRSSVDARTKGGRVMAAKKKAKRAPVDQLRWAILDDEGACHVFGPKATRADAAGYRDGGWRTIRVRVTEVTK
jgi:hypothetical protein